MTTLYNLVIGLYHFTAWLISPFNKKAKSFTSGRRGWQKKLTEQIVPGTRYVWFHCASLGEFEQGRPVIEEFIAKYPNHKVAITFYSPSGYEIRKNYAHASVVLYLPADTKRNAKQFLDILNPELAFFIKYEFWHHFLSSLKHRSIPAYLISGIFRPEQPFFTSNPWGSWFRSMLSCFDHIFVQDSISATLLNSAGFEDVSVAGDTRFDRVAAVAESSKPIEVVNKFAGQQKILIAGSTWKEDEELITEYILGHAKEKWIIAPHEVGKANVERLQQMLKNRAITLSAAEKDDPSDYQVLIIDSIGKLSALYRYGRIAYIGGGFGAGIHNILEAAAYGMPILFGTNYGKFREAKDLIEQGAAFSLTNAYDLNQTLSHLLNQPTEIDRLSRNAQDYVTENRGATHKILSQIIVQ